MYKNTLDMRKIGILLTCAILFGVSSCEEEVEYVYENGVYYAEDAEAHYGWKGFLEIEIKNDDLVTVDFDYFNDAGDLKSETTDEEYPMDPHPRIWLPQYEAALLASDILAYADIDAVTGATGGGASINGLIALLIEAAKTGDTSTQILPAE